MNDLYEIEFLEIKLFDHLIVRINKMYLQIIYLIYISKQDLTCNEWQWLMCH